MAVRETTDRPESFAHFPAGTPYRWLELHHENTPYAHCAFVERDDFLELHITLHSWGTATLRRVRQDLKWLKAEARRLGKSRIMGIRADDKGRFDDRLFKFARLFGFQDMHVFQTATLKVD